VLDVHVGDVAQVQRPILAPADDEVAELGDRLTAVTRTVNCRRPTLANPADTSRAAITVSGEALRRQPERGETVRIEVDLDFSRPPSFEVDARNPLIRDRRGSTTSSMSFWYSAAMFGNRVARRSGRTCSDPAFWVWKLSRQILAARRRRGQRRQVLSRETTSSMTRVMSVPISNLSPTLPKPRFDSERISTSPGIPRIASRSV
jgi:hypothetical protein